VLSYLAQFSTALDNLYAYLEKCIWKLAEVFCAFIHYKLSPKPVNHKRTIHQMVRDGFLYFIPIKSVNSLVYRHHREIFPQKCMSDFIGQIFVNERFQRTRSVQTYEQIRTGFFQVIKRIHHKQLHSFHGFDFFCHFEERRIYAYFGSRRVLIEIRDEWRQHDRIELWAFLY